MLGYACVVARERRWRRAAGAVALAALFLGNIFLVVTSRTALLVAPLMLLLLGFREFHWKGLLGTALIGCTLALAVWSGSPYLRGKLLGSIDEYRAYRDTGAANSTGLHVEFLRKSLSFVESAPVVGHGTGSIDELFRKAAVDQEGAAGTLTQNPHNQIFAVAIQLGFLGTIVLLAMWLAHLMLFRGGGLTGWIGLVVVVDNIVSSLFNSHLFDFTAGWLYVFGVGVAGGMILRERDSA
jgi:O-antigen ligase